MAARITKVSEARVFGQQAAEFDAKAATLDREIAALEERDPSAIGSTPMRLEQSSTPVAARRWRMKAEEIRTTAESMHGDEARRTLGRLARDYEAVASSAERAAGLRRAKHRDAG